MNKKAKILIIYGPIAVGKLTVSKILAKKLKYKLTHNHAINDLVDEVFERGSKERDWIIEKLRFIFYDLIAKSKINTIITHCFSYDYVSSTGLSDPQYLKKIENIISKNGCNPIFVHLKATPKKLLSRVDGQSRKAYGKLRDKKIMKGLLNKDWETSANLKNQIVIDNTNLTPQQTANIIYSEINKRFK